MGHPDLTVSTFMEKSVGLPRVISLLLAAVAGCEDCIKIDDYDSVNILILVPHGGSERLDGLQDRPEGGCYNSTTEMCKYNQDVTTVDSDE